MSCYPSEKYLKQYDPKAVKRCKCGNFRLLGTICDKDISELSKVYYKL